MFRNARCAGSMTFFEGRAGSLFGSPHDGHGRMRGA